MQCGLCVACDVSGEEGAFLWGFVTDEGSDGADEAESGICRFGDDVQCFGPVTN